MTERPESVGGHDGSLATVYLSSWVKQRGGKSASPPGRLPLPSTVPSGPQCLAQQFHSLRCTEVLPVVRG